MTELILNYFTLIKRSEGKKDPFNKSWCCRGVLVSLADQNLPLRTCKNPSTGLQGVLSHRRQNAVGFNGRTICPDTWVGIDWQSHKRLNGSQN